MIISAQDINTIESAKANGNRCQLIAHPDETVTAHEHIGNGWTKSADGVTIGHVAQGMTAKDIATGLAPLSFAAAKRIANDGATLAELVY